MIQHFIVRRWLSTPALFSFLSPYLIALYMTFLLARLDVLHLLVINGILLQIFSFTITGPLNIRKVETRLNVTQWPHGHSRIQRPCTKRELKHWGERKGRDYCECKLYPYRAARTWWSYYHILLPPMQ